MKYCLTVKCWILLLVIGSGQALLANLPTRILEADLTAVQVQGSVVITASSNGDLLRSTDGGITFETRHNGDPADVFHAIGGSGNTLIAVGAGGWILRSADNGQNWSQVSADTLLGTLNGVATNGNGFWVAVGQHMHSGAAQVSSDDGQSWTLHTISSVNLFTGIAWHPGSNQFLASGGDGFFTGSLQASSNGSIWSSVNFPGNTPMLHFVTSDGANGLLAGGEQGALLRSSVSPVNFSAVGGFQPSETLRSAVSTAQGSWIIGGDQAIVVEIPSAAAGARLKSTPLAAAGAIISMANRGGEELLLAGAFSDYPWGAPELQVQVSGNQLILRVQNARLGRSYRVQGSSNLNQWSNLSGTTQQATQHTLEWTVTPDATQRFFRILVD